MLEHLPLSIGIGLVVSLLFSEAFGLAAGGMVVPGYVALYWNEPFHIVVTLAAALITYFLIRILSTITIIYGRRRTVIMIIVGYIVAISLNLVFSRYFHTPSTEVSIIGFIISGLIAIWIDRQGFVETATALVSASVIIRLILILLVGNDLS